MPTEDPIPAGRGGMPHDRPDQDDGTENRVRRERSDERIGREPRGVQPDVARADDEARAARGEKQPVRNTPPSGPWNDTSHD